MSIADFLPLLMFPVLFLLILTGFPVAFVLGGTGIVFGLIGHFFEIFSLSDFGFLPARIFGVISNFTLIAVPLFILMGLTLEKSGIAEELLDCVEILFRPIKGGFTVSIVFVGALLAASTGIVGATVVTMGLLSLPPMLARGYDRSLSCGTIAASGTLGQIIPPSIVLVLLGDMMNVAVADLFAAALLPGLLLIGLYMIYILIRSKFNPALAPQQEFSRDLILNTTFARRLLAALIPPIALIAMVLGSILFGVASPTESAGCGAFAALSLALLKRKLAMDVLQDILLRTTSITSMVFTLLIGAQVFSIVFRGMYGDEIIIDLIQNLDASANMILFVVMALVFILGFFLDFIEICFIVVPIITPLLAGELGFDKVWLAILLAVNLQTSFLTPPFGFALFYLKGVAPEEVRTIDIYRGVMPFVALQLLALLLLSCFPKIVSFLPELLYRMP